MIEEFFYEFETKHGYYYFEIVIDREIKKATIEMYDESPAETWKEKIAQFFRKREPICTRKVSMTQPLTEVIQDMIFTWELPHVQQEELDNLPQFLDIDYQEFLRRKRWRWQPDQHIQYDPALEGMVIDDFRKDHLLITKNGVAVPIPRHMHENSMKNLKQFND